MKRIRVGIASAGVFIAAGLLVPVGALADGSHQGQAGDHGGKNTGAQTTSVTTSSGSNQKSDDHDGDHGDHPVVAGTTGTTTTPVVKDDDGQENQGKHLGNDVLKATLAPSVTTDPLIFAVNPGGVSWSLSSGTVRLQVSGRIEVNVDGLVVTSTGVNPVPDIAASVYCNGTIAATTAPVAFSSNGDATIKDTVTLPSTCMVQATSRYPRTSRSTGLPPDCIAPDCIA